MVWLLMGIGLLLVSWGVHDLLPASVHAKNHYPIPRRAAKWMLTIGLLAFFSGVGWYAETKSQTPTASAKVANHSAVEAWTFCQQFVADRLIAPRTAKYPARLTSEFVTFLGGSSYRAQNYVDSQNAYGAMIRTRFTCEVSKVPGSEAWRLDSLVME